MNTAADSELAHKILTLLRRGPYMLPEIERYCRPHAPDDVHSTLLQLEAARTVERNPVTELYSLVAAL